MQFTKMMPVAGLLTGAIVWGLIWYPYRALDHAGVSGALAATLTYAGAFALAAALLCWRQIRPHLSWLLVAIGLSAGWANIGFTLAVIYGDVMRVVLLFYLAPVWTVLFARLLLNERLTAPGYGLMLLAITGALVMLWQPQLGWPLPRSMAEWIGLSAGIMFALSNVLVRMTARVAIELKVLAVFGGCGAIGSICMLFGSPAPAAWSQVLDQAALLTVLSVVIFSVNVAVQYGLARVGANRAIVIYLFELVITAIAAWLLADELLTLKEWCGGALIIVAGLLSDRLGVAPESKPASSACSTAPAARPD